MVHLDIIGTDWNSLFLVVDLSAWGFQTFIGVFNRTTGMSGHIFGYFWMGLIQQPDKGLVPENGREELESLQISRSSYFKTGWFRKPRSHTLALIIAICGYTPFSDTPISCGSCLKMGGWFHDISCNHRFDMYIYIARHQSHKVIIWPLAYVSLGNYYMAWWGVWFWGWCQSMTKQIRPDEEAAWNQKCVWWKAACLRLSFYHLHFASSRCI